MSAQMQNFKLVVLGDGGVGKTALTIQLCLNQFIETYDPTIEDSYRKPTMIDDRPCLLEILDTAGQEEYTTLRDQWIREGEGFVLVYSITARATFERIERFRDPIVRSKNSETVPIMLVGNKADQDHDREVSKEEGEAMARKLGCKFIETSAKTRMNLEKAYFEVVRDIREQREKKLGPVSRKERRRKCTIL